MKLVGDRVAERVWVGSSYGGLFSHVDQNGLRGEHSGSISFTTQGSRSGAHIDQLSWETRSWESSWHLALRWMEMGWRWGSIIWKSCCEAGSGTSQGPAGAVLGMLRSQLRLQTTLSVAVLSLPWALCNTQEGGCLCSSWELLKKDNRTWELRGGCSSTWGGPCQIEKKGSLGLGEDKRWNSRIPNPSMLISLKNTEEIIPRGVWLFIILNLEHISPPADVVKRNWLEQVEFIRKAFS